MRDYAKVSPRFWIGETGRQIRAVGCHAQVLSFYLMTSPHANMLGLYYMPLPFIVHETGIPLEGASKALQSLKNVGFCSYDQETEFVWVHEMARFQIAEKLKPDDKRVVGIRNEYRELSNNPFLEPFFNKYQEAFGLSEMRSYKPPKPVENPPSSSDFDQTTKGQVRPFGGASMGHRSQEQEQEHEQEQKENSPTQPGLTGKQPTEEPPAAVNSLFGDHSFDQPKGGRKPKPSPIGFDEFWDHYPRKEDKDTARKAFAKLKPNAALVEEIISALDAQKHQFETMDKLDIWHPEWKYPATWLNKKSWKNEIVSDAVLESRAKKPINGTRRTPAPDNFADKDYQKDATPMKDLYWLDPEHRTEH